MSGDVLTYCANELALISVFKTFSICTIPLLYSSTSLAICTNSSSNNSNDAERRVNRLRISLGISYCDLYPSPCSISAHECCNVVRICNSKIIS